LRRTVPGLSRKSEVRNPSRCCVTLRPSTAHRRRIAGGAHRPTMHCMGDRYARARRAAHVASRCDTACMSHGREGLLMHSWLSGVRIEFFHLHQHVVEVTPTRPRQNPCPDPHAPCEDGSHDHRHERRVAPSHGGANEARPDSGSRTSRPGDREAPSGLPAGTPRSTVMRNHRISNHSTSDLRMAFLLSSLVCRQHCKIAVRLDAWCLTVVTGVRTSLPNGRGGKPEQPPVKRRK
jgi:hypothetical protein